MIAIADVKEERSPGRAPRIPLLSAFVMLTRFELGAISRPCQIDFFVLRS